VKKKKGKKVSYSLNLIIVIYSVGYVAEEDAEIEFE
jgi:hypothetical protein